MAEQDQGTAVHLVAEQEKASGTTLNGRAGPGHSSTHGGREGPRHSGTLGGRAGERKRHYTLWQGRTRAWQYIEVTEQKQGVFIRLYGYIHKEIP
jgi:hypothetical protein